MIQPVRVSLANKCQLLFGAAVILILTAALAVVWLRMHTLVELGPQKRAADLAEMWLAGQLQLGGAALRPDRSVQSLPPEVQLTLTLVERSDFDRVVERDPFLGQAIERFELRPSANDWFGRTEDIAGDVYYRYVRAIRDTPTAVDADADADDAAAGHALRQVLVIHLRDRDAPAQHMVNRIYTIAAGTFAGLLAVGVFWFITTRLILSPVRLLRDVTRKVADGDLNLRSDINTGDEFQELSDAFNTMLEHLNEQQQQLRSVNKSLDLKLGELAESNVALYEANKVKGEFLANVSHELRTPLNSMIGFAEVLQETLADREGPMDEKRKRYVQHIITASRRLLELINDLLDLAKIEAGRAELNIAPVSLADTCEGLINLMRPQSSKRNVLLKQKIEPNLPLVHTDAGKLQQILFNFLANAVKFTPPAGVVTLSVKHIPPTRPGGHAFVRLSVSDTGPGIATEDQERIFEKFTQLDPSVTREVGGTGLGLTISKELADLLHGRIEVDSDVGQGATFSITIPVIFEKRSAPLMPEIA
ncbi:ATP-binding protein [Phycisphaerales bacterium AB-hyl4]|uniref:histidine kinase n=1 Tax=Natronomicrosphaera hydrolytica TaxID=3242702 RepID=A0ABV4U8H3_9BACT